MLKINHIEITNRCNLNCDYCPHSNSSRPPIDMSYEIFRRALSYVKKTKERLIILHAFGEPLLHPQLEDFLALASKLDLFPGFSTNGLLLNEQRFENLAKSGLKWMCISLHKSESIDIYQRLPPLAHRYRILLWARGFYNQSPGFKIKDIEYIKKHDFANTAPSKLNKIIRINGALNCDFIKYNFACILSDGTITACCYDERGINKRSHIDNITGCIYKREYTLCKNCAGMRFYNKYQNKIINLINLCPSIINIPGFKHIILKYL